MVDPGTGLFRPVNRTGQQGVASGDPDTSAAINSRNHIGEDMSSSQETTKNANEGGAPADKRELTPQELEALSAGGAPRAADGFRNETRARDIAAKYMAEGRKDVRITPTPVAQGREIEWVVSYET
jgi:hypothetical protein